MLGGFRIFQRRVLTAFLFVGFFCLGTSSVFALEVPKRPDGYVHDQAKMLSPQTRNQLTLLLRQFEMKTTNQIVVATFPSLEGENLEDFSIRLAEAWKPGQKGKDNGVILSIYKADRKIRIEVGYGLEGALPDAEAGRIIQQVISPAFKQGQFERGILEGATAIMQAVVGEFTAPSRSYGNTYERELTPEELAAMQKQASQLFALIVIAVLALFVIDLFRYGGYARSHRVYKDRYSFWEWFFRFAILLAVISIIFRILFYALLFSRGGYGGSRGGGGGGFSGGGGGFGGGGASGGW